MELEASSSDAAPCPPLLGRYRHEAGRMHVGRTGTVMPAACMCPKGRVRVELMQYSSYVHFIRHHGMAAGLWPHWTQAVPCSADPLGAEHAEQRGAPMRCCPTARSRLCCPHPSRSAHAQPIFQPPHPCCPSPPRISRLQLALLRLFAAGFGQVGACMRHVCAMCAPGRAWLDYAVVWERCLPA